MITPLVISPSAAAAAVAPVATVVAARVAPLVISPATARAYYPAVAPALGGGVTSGAVPPSAAATAGGVAGGAAGRVAGRVAGGVRAWLRRRGAGAARAKAHDTVAAQLLLGRVPNLVRVLSHRLGHVRGRRRRQGHVQRGALEKGRRQPHMPICEDAVAQRANARQSCQREPSEENRLVRGHIALDPPPRRRLLPPLLPPADRPSTLPAPQAGAIVSLHFQAGVGTWLGSGLGLGLGLGLG